MPRQVLPRRAQEKSDVALITVPAGQVWRSYYFAGGARVSLRERTSTSNVLYYLLVDHLGSVTVSYRTSDGQVLRQKYKPWGEYRPGPVSSLLADHGFTGQRWAAGLGLYFFNARWYDPAHGMLHPARPVPE